MKRSIFYRCFLRLGVVCLFVGAMAPAAETPAGKVIIHEIMYNTPGGKPAEEWLELRNLSTDPIALRGWSFSRGIDFSFTNGVLPALGYLVVAANGAEFHAQYPAVSNVVGDWVGSLANSDETIELRTGEGELVNSVHYASEGDWARRERGRGASLATRIARSGNSATVTVFNHGFTGNDQVLISGADQPQYNGRFTISAITPSTFNISVSGNPPSPATGSILVRQVVDDGASGWSWFSASDGFGSSLELVNPALPNSSGQNWKSSVQPKGTPGSPNSVASPDVAPLISDVSHFPAIPRSTEPVAITARLRDELTNGVQRATLFYRNHTTASPGVFSSTNMLDDGKHGDGLISDGLFGAVLPPAAHGTVIEFYVEASDLQGLSRTWPAPAWETNNTTAQIANALYQIDDEIITNLMPAVRVILTGTELAKFPPANRNSDAEANATFISTDGEGVKIRYLSGVRVRGAGSRTQTPPNNRLNIPNDNRWNGLSAVNLNGQYVHSQLIGSAVSQKSGLPAADAHVVQYRINGVNPAPLTAPAGRSGAGYGTFILVEPVNGDLAADLFPQDGGGNVYRASSGRHMADLSYQGTNIEAYLSRGYFKTSNQSENDWSDLMGLTFALDKVVSDADYLQAVHTNLNTLMWMRYFAVGTLVNFGETAMFNGRGDDYALYRGERDRRFIPIGHDFDTIFGQGDTTTSYATQTNSSIYIMLNPPNTGSGGGPFGGNPPNMPLLRRLLTHPEFAPMFYSELKRLTETVFAPEQLGPLMDQLLSGWGNGPTLLTIQTMKNFAANRRANVLAQIPLRLTINSSLGSSNGFRFSSTPSAKLIGSSHAIETRKVLVNGVQSSWSAWDARWTNTVSLRPGINRVVVQAVDRNDSEFERETLDIWYDDGSTQQFAGDVSTNTEWNATNGPYHITGNLTVRSGVTLKIQAGTTIYLDSGVMMTIENGGQLLAEGADAARIQFARTPGATATWGGISINGGPSSPESRIAYAHFADNGATAIHSTDGTVFLDHLTFGNTAKQYVSLDRSSFIVQDCVFPSATATFELVHGTGGIKAGGRGIFVRNYFGKPIGYNDTVDFTGGNRPGPIVQFINNVFTGSDDDILDLDSTDAWIEGNIFLHSHRNGSPDSSSGVSGGSDNADTSQITVVGNLFYDVDHAANAKQGNFYTFVNNTIVHQTKVGGVDTDAGVITLADERTALGAGLYLEANIIFDADKLVRTQGVAVVTFTNNILPLPWTGPGGNNLIADPLFKHLPLLSETTNFTSFADAQVLWDWFSLQPGSPAHGSGPGGRDKGGVIPLGVVISGEPIGVTPFNSAVLQVGVNRTGSGIPVEGFPDGSGFTHYRWRLDNGPWSGETAIAQPIQVHGLPAGPHAVTVSGKRDSGFYQDDASYGSDAGVSVSGTWIVDPAASPVRLNEVLASNGGSVNYHQTTPDLIEIYNSSDAPFSVAGLKLTDDITNPDKFVFPAGTTIDPQGYLVLYANDPDGTPGIHVGFGLNSDGDALYLFGASSSGGQLLDSIQFGLQFADVSIGRLENGEWALTEPTFGSKNRAARVGDPRSLRLNEWLAIAQTPFNSDFIELYNPDPLPVDLGGLFLSDEIIGWPNRHKMTPLSFISGGGYLRLFADAGSGGGADHLTFALNGDQGAIGLYLPDLTVIDCVWYQPQKPNISQGRSPNGSSTLVFFDIPTPGAPNPANEGPGPFGGLLVINEVLANNAGILEPDGSTPDWIELYNGTTNVVDLSNLSLTDDTTIPRRFVFVPGVRLPAAGHLRVLCSDVLPASATTAGFSLSATGGGIYLFDDPARGGALLNSIVYGIQAPDLSIGRVPSGGTNWTLNSPSPNAGNSAIPTLGETSRLKVNEWMADPDSGSDWFEIFNPNTLPVALAGLYLTDDLNARTKHRIAPLSFLGSGTNAYLRFHADGNTGAGADHVNFSLRAGGEAVGISSENGALIDGVVFGPQQTGVSEGRFPDGGSTVLAFPGTGSPGRSNWRLLQEVAINEVLTHTELPLEDAIELYNLTSQAIDIGGWWLSDDNSTLQKFQIPQPTLLPAHGFVVVYETSFANAELASVPFLLSSHGDEVVLSAATGNVLTGYRTTIGFGAAENGVSFGRFLTSDERVEIVAMKERTFGVDLPTSVEEFRTGTGRTNSGPRVGPIVISEIMYHPSESESEEGAFEFIELHNITSTSVSLFESTNAWNLQDAVEFDFSKGTLMRAGEYLLVVGFDPVRDTGALEMFRNRYHIATNTTVVGPYRGKLANDTDSIELRRPGVPDTNGVDFILVERVHYSDKTPWPVLADGSSLSLQRIADTAFGNDPANWKAASPTPGPPDAFLDTDHDGMPDAWENEFGLDPLNPADAGEDADRDGLANLQEFQIGSDPKSASSGIRLEIALVPPGSSVVLEFNIPSNFSYILEYAESFGGQWVGLESVVSTPSVRRAQHVLPASEPLRLYRIRQI